LGRHGVPNSVNAKALYLLHIECMTRSFQRILDVLDLVLVEALGQQPLVGGAGGVFSLFIDPLRGLSTSTRWRRAPLLEPRRNPPLSATIAVGTGRTRFARIIIPHRRTEFILTQPFQRRHAARMA
jgi:hypothetical protein